MNMNQRNNKKEKKKRNKGFPYRIASKLFGKEIETKPERRRCAYCNKLITKKDEKAGNVAYYNAREYHSECQQREKYRKKALTTEQRRKNALESLRMKRWQR